MAGLKVVARPISLPWSIRILRFISLFTFFAIFTTMVGMYKSSNLDWMPIRNSIKRPQRTVSNSHFSTMELSYYKFTGQLPIVESETQSPSPLEFDLTKLEDLNGEGEGAIVGVKKRPSPGNQTYRASMDKMFQDSYPKYTIVHILSFYLIVFILCLSPSVMWEQQEGVVLRRMLNGIVRTLKVKVGGASPNATQRSLRLYNWCNFYLKYKAQGTLKTNFRLQLVMGATLYPCLLISGFICVLFLEDMEKMCLISSRENICHPVTGEQLPCLAPLQKFSERTLIILSVLIGCILVSFPHWLFIKMKLFRSDLFRMYWLISGRTDEELRAETITLCVNFMQHPDTDYGDWHMLVQLGRTLTPGCFRELLAAMMSRINSGQ